LGIIRIAIHFKRDRIIIPKTNVFKEYPVLSKYKCHTRKNREYTRLMMKELFSPCFLINKESAMLVVV
jgi:hypothetical protein